MRPPPATCRARSRSSRGGPPVGCPQGQLRGRAELYALIQTSPQQHLLSHG